FKVVLESARSDPCIQGGCIKYLKALIRQLKAGKDKDFSKMKIEFQVDNAENYLISVAAEEETHVKMGMWVRKLVCLVPIQIARVENNAMVALKDGLQIPHYISYVDSVSLANSIRFGFYDAVLSSWKGKIKGLGSFERSEQEDMLLSVLNAAVSNLTIFNKKDFHLDKDTESAFSRFQSGINLLKQDKNKSQDNFILKMYDGKVEIVAMAPYNRSEYYKESLRELTETVEDKIYSCYDNGSTFLRDLKLIIAQIAAKDWTSIDSKCVAVIVDILRRNLMSGVHTGCLSANANEELQVFVIFDTQEEIPDSPIVVGDLSCDIKDSGLYLTPSNDSLLSVTIREVLSQLRSSLELVLPRKGRNGEEWHSMFENFLESLTERRQDRVQKWISANSVEFSDNDVVQRLQLEASVALGKGQRGSFEYDLVSEQNGLRKGCCIPIPPFEIDHQGPHVHTKNEDSVHYCDSRCQSCGYFCQLPIDHSGLHDTVHGNMRNVRFISDSEDIEIHDRKYKWGERGEAEMCNMYCRKLGRGHIHLVPCPDSACTNNLYNGSRHATVKYGPDVDIAKDEMTHETYWQCVRFVDPCTEEEREEFGRCNHHCKSEEHETEVGGSDKSYCTEKLWHPPIKRTGQNISSAGYITDDGHHFGCDHSKNVPHHVIFVIDRSGSMQSSDISPTMGKFNDHNSRLGCVYEAILRFIQACLRTVSDDSVSVVLFDTSATVA
ncbi:hypothetical protein KI387_043423, partial [Taxus chinensis]